MCEAHTINVLLHSESPARSESKRAKVSYSVDGIIEDISNQGIVSEDLVKLSRAIGESQKYSIIMDAKACSSTYKDNLNSFDVWGANLKRKIVVLTFLSSVVGVDDIKNKLKPKENYC